MKKRSIIELTAFVDILLILLFAFLFNISETKEKAVSTETQNTKLAQENFNLKNELAKINESNKDLEGKNEKLESQNNFYKKFYKEISSDIEKAFKNIQMPENLDNESLVKINDFINKENINLDYLIKNEGLFENFFELDIEIKGEKPEIILNNKNIDFSLNYEQYNSANSRNKKLNELTDKIESSLKTNGIPQMIYITIKQSDEEVYLYSYNLLIESIKEIQKKYGADRVYYTEIPFLFNY